MLYSTKQKIIILAMWILLIILSIITLKTQFYPVEETAPTVNIAVNTFFHIFNGNRVMIFFFIGFIIVIPSIFPIIYFKYFNNHFVSYINTRISYKKYSFLILFKTFFNSFLFYILLNVAILLIIHFLYFPINFNTDFNIYKLFSDNQVTNLCFYIFFSSIGFAIYNSFLLQLIPFIKNEFIYRAISLLNFIIGLLLFIAIQQFMGIFGSSDLIRIISSFIVPINLFTPGLLFESYGFLSFICSAIFYILISLVLYILSYRELISNG